MSYVVLPPHVPAPALQVLLIAERTHLMPLAARLLACRPHEAWPDVLELRLESICDDIGLLRLQLPATWQADCLHCLRQIFPTYPVCDSDNRTLRRHIRPYHILYNQQAPLLVALLCPFADALRDLVRERLAISGPAQELLSKQERAVLYALAEGLRYKQIAHRHCVAPSTIKSQVYSIYQKLGVHTRTEALNKALGAA